MTLASTQVEMVVEAHDTQSGKKIVNNTHWLNLLGTPPSTSKFDLVTAFGALWELALIADLSSHYVIDRYRIRNIDDPLDAYEDINPSTPAGGGTPPTIPTSESVTLQLVTAFRGRSYRGSLHLWGIVDADVEDNRLKAAAAASYIDALRVALLAGISIGGETWYLAVWSRKLSPTTVTPGSQVMSVVTSMPINLTMGTMRHRRERTATA